MGLLLPNFGARKRVLCPVKVVRACRLVSYWTLALRILGTRAPAHSKTHEAPRLGNGSLVARPTAAARLHAAAARTEHEEHTTVSKQLKNHGRQ